LGTHSVNDREQLTAYAETRLDNPRSDLHIYGAVQKSCSCLAEGQQGLAGSFTPANSPSGVHDSRDDHSIGLSREPDGALNTWCDDNPPDTLVSIDEHDRPPCEKLVYKPAANSVAGFTIPTWFSRDYVQTGLVLPPAISLIEHLGECEACALACGGVGGGKGRGGKQRRGSTPRRKPSTKKKSTRKAVKSAIKKGIQPSYNREAPAIRKKVAAFVQEAHRKPNGRAAKALHEEKVRNGPESEAGFSEMVGAMGGHMAGQYYGGDLGGQFGEMAGKMAGKASDYLMNKIMGSGDYTVMGPHLDGAIAENSLLDLGPTSHTSTSPVSFGPGNSRFKHSEYIGNLTMTTGFNLITYSLDVTDPTTFPWLHAIAANYQKWKPLGMVITIKSTSANAVAEGNPSMGTVGVVAVYDVYAPLPVNMQGVLNTDGAGSIKPSENLIVAIECATALTQSLPLRILTSGMSPPDFSLYKLGTLLIATEGANTTYAGAAEIWIEFDIELLQPRALQGPTLISTALYNLETSFGGGGYPLKPIDDTVDATQPLFNSVGVEISDDSKWHQIKFPLTTQVGSVFLVLVTAPATNNTSPVNTGFGGGQSSWSPFPAIGQCFQIGGGFEVFNLWGRVGYASDGSFNVQAPGYGPSPNGVASTILVGSFKYIGGGTELIPPSISVVDSIFADDAVGDLLITQLNPNIFNGSTPAITSISLLGPKPKKRATYSPSDAQRIALHLPADETNQPAWVKLPVVVEEKCSGPLSEIRKGATGREIRRRQINGPQGEYTATDDLANVNPAGFVMSGDSARAALNAKARLGWAWPAMSVFPVTGTPNTYCWFGRSEPFGKQVAQQVAAAGGWNARTIRYTNSVAETGHYLSLADYERQNPPVPSQINGANGEQTGTDDLAAPSGRDQPKIFECDQGLMCCRDTHLHKKKPDDKKNMQKPEEKKGRTVTLEQCKYEFPLLCMNALHYHTGLERICSSEYHASRVRAASDQSSPSVVFNFGGTTQCREGAAKDEKCSNVADAGGKPVRDMRSPATTVLPAGSPDEKSASSDSGRLKQQCRWCGTQAMGDPCDLCEQRRRTCCTLCGSTGSGDPCRPCRSRGQTPKVADRTPCCYLCGSPGFSDICPTCKSERDAVTLGDSIDSKHVDDTNVTNATKLPVPPSQASLLASMAAAASSTTQQTPILPPPSPPLVSFQTPHQTRQPPQIPLSKAKSVHFSPDPVIIPPSVFMSFPRAILRLLSGRPSSGAPSVPIVLEPVEDDTPEIAAVLKESEAIASTLLSNKDLDSRADRTAYVAKLSNRLRHSVAAKLGYGLGPRVAKIVKTAERQALDERIGAALDRRMSPYSESIVDVLFDSVAGTPQADHSSRELLRERVYHGSPMFTTEADLEGDTPMQRLSDLEKSPICSRRASHWARKFLYPTCGLLRVFSYAAVEESIKHCIFRLYPTTSPPLCSHVYDYGQEGIQQGFSQASSFTRLLHPETDDIRLIVSPILSGELSYPKSWQVRIPQPLPKEHLEVKTTVVAERLTNYSPLACDLPRVANGWLRKTTIIREASDAKFRLSFTKFAFGFVGLISLVESVLAERRRRRWLWRRFATRLLYSFTAHSMLLFLPRPNAVLAHAALNSVTFLSGYDLQLNVVGAVCTQEQRHDRVLTQSEYVEKRNCTAVAKDEPCDEKFGARSLWGVDGFYADVYRNCVHNEILSLEGRVGKLLPQHSRRESVLCAWAGLCIDQLPRLLSHMEPVVTPVPFDDWVSTFPPHKQRDFRAMELDGYEMKQQTTAKSFIKQELTMRSSHHITKHKDPRMIQGGPAELTMACSPYIRKLAKHFRSSVRPSKHNWVGDIRAGRQIVYTSGLNANQIGDAYSLALEAIEAMCAPGEYVVVVEDDESRYDEHMTRGAFALLELYYARTLPPHVVKHLMRSPCSKGKTSLGTRYSVPYTMQSGWPDTSVGDSIVNAAMKYHVHGAERTWVTLICGDDSVTVTTTAELKRLGGSMGIEAKYAELGMECEVVVRYDPLTAEFCSSRFFPANGTFILVPKIGKFLGKLGWDRVDRTPENQLSWGRGVMEVVRHYSAIDPTLFALYDTISRQLGSGKVVRTYDSVNRYSYTAPTEGTTTPDDVTAYYSTHYGFSHGDLCALVAEIQTLRVHEMGKGPLMQHVCQVDCVC